MSDTDEIADAIDPLTEEVPVKVPEQASMDRAVKHVVKARFHFFYDKQISENNRLAQLFADAINVAPGLQYHVRKRLVRFSSLKFQESSKARRRLRRDLDTLLEGNVACSEDLVDLSKRFWDPPGLQTVAPDGDGDGAENVWDPAADPVTRRTILSLALTWDPELQSLYRVVRTFFSEQWLGPSAGAGDVAPVQQSVVDIVDEDEQRLITATALCHRELTGVLGRRKQNSLYQLLNRLHNRHVAASHAWQQARNPPPKKSSKDAKPKGKRRPPAVPKLVTADIVESEVVARLQKHPRALALVRSLFGGSLQRAHLKSLTDNAVLLAQVKRHFRDIEMTEPEDEANTSTEPEDKQDDKHRLTFVASDVMHDMVKEREGAQVAEDDGVGQWEGDADRAPSPVVWHMRSQVRGYAEADDDHWAPSLPDNGGAVVFTNMQVPSPTTCLPTHSLTHSATRSSSNSPIHSLTYSPTHPPTH